MDVVTAFLNGLLPEEEVVYMKAPEGAGLPPGTVVVLRRMLYGLKQSPRKWNERLNDFLLSMSFHRSTNDSALYWRGEGDKYDYILVYVDDLLIITPTKSDSLAAIKEALAKEFDMKDMGELKSFLGIEITRDRTNRTMKLIQKGYIDTILEHFGFTDAAPVKTPMVTQTSRVN